MEPTGNSEIVHRIHAAQITILNSGVIVAFIFLLFLVGYDVSISLLAFSAVGLLIFTPVYLAAVPRLLLVSIDGIALQYRDNRIRSFRYVDIVRISIPLSRLYLPFVFGWYMSIHLVDGQVIRIPPPIERTRQLVAELRSAGARVRS